MIRTLKALGLALTAVLALGAVMASAASAEIVPAQFHSDEPETAITGEQTVTNTFSVNAGTTHCKKAHFEGEVAAQTTQEVTVDIEYKECQLTAFGGEALSAIVDVNGCGYLLTANGQVHVECPGTNKIQVTAPFCTVTVPPQTVETAKYQNAEVEGTSVIDVVAEVEGIDYTQSAFCPTGGGTFNNGTYKGTVRTTGENAGGEAVGISWTPESETET